MGKPPELSGKLLARNTLFNFIGQAVPLLVGVVTIPFIVRGLGTERFGLLSLAWVILGYFVIFDLGLGRATTKFVAEALGRGEEEQVPCLVWTAVTVQAILGMVGTLVLIGITPFLMERLLNISLELVEEAKVIFYLLALSIPVVLVSSSFSGVLQAKQRFDLVNAVRIPVSISVQLLTIVGLALDFHLSGIVGLILISRLAAFSFLIVLAIHVFPQLRRLPSSFALFSQLFAYGSWITVTNAVTLLLRYLSRFIIGALISMSAVAYFSVPFDILEHLWIIPLSLVMTLFPAFSSLSGAGHSTRTHELLVSSVKHLLILMSPLVYLLIVFANTILQVWLTEEFAQNSTLIFQLLAIGTLVAVPASIPMSIIQGYGRADLTAKLYLALTPVNIALDLILVKSMNVPGAALSYVLKALIDTPLLFMIALRIIHMPLILFFKCILRTIVIVCLFGFLFWSTIWISGFLKLQVTLISSIIAIFALLAWHWLLNDAERTMLRSLLKGEQYG